MSVIDQPDIVMTYVEKIVVCHAVIIYSIYLSDSSYQNVLAYFISSTNSRHFVVLIKLANNSTT